MPHGERGNTQQASVCALVVAQQARGEHAILQQARLALSLRRCQQARGWRGDDRESEAKCLALGSGFRMRPET